MESLLHTATKKFYFYNFESCFHKRQVSFLVVKTAKCKRGIRYKRYIDVLNHLNETKLIALYIECRGFDFLFSSAFNQHLSTVSIIEKNK